MWLWTSLVCKMTSLFPVDWLLAHEDNADNGATDERMGAEANAMAPSLLKKSRLEIEESSISFVGIVYLFEILMRVLEGALTCLPASPIRSRKSVIRSRSATPL